MSLVRERVKTVLIPHRATLLYTRRAIPRDGVAYSVLGLLPACGGEDDAPGARSTAANSQPTSAKPLAATVTIPTTVAGWSFTAQRGHCRIGFSYPTHEGVADVPAA